MFFGTSGSLGSARIAPPSPSIVSSSDRLFSEVGRQVSWQQLGDEFKDHQFCFHVLDEAQEEGRDWKDEMQALLSSDGAS